MTSAEFKDSWERTVISLINESPTPDETYKKLAVDGTGAWKLLLNLPPKCQILEIGAGVDSRIHHLTDLDVQLYLLDEDNARLDFSKKRCRQQLAKAPVSFLLGNLGQDLPFATGSLDCILLSRPFNCLHSHGSLGFLATPLAIGSANQPLMQLLKECRRVLKDSGQLFVVWDNLLGYTRLNVTHLLTAQQSTLWGYQHLLKLAGFRQLQTYDYQQSKSQLHHLVPLQTGTSPLLSLSRPGKHTLKSRLKKNRQLAPTLAFIASPETKQKSSLLEEVIQAVSSKLQEQLGNGKLCITDHEITRKEKLVIAASWGTQEFIIKLPLNKTACDSEMNNVDILKSLAVQSGQSRLFATALCDGEINKQPFFVETKLTGEPLSQQLLKQGRLAYLDQVSGLLKTLFTQSGAVPESKTLDSDIYEAHIQQRIDWIYRANGDTDLKNQLERYFAQNLKGIPVSLGMLHGDFSVSNIFTKGGDISGLIDWETGDKQGLPILDAINYLDSVQRLLNPGMMINQSIPQQASGQWPIAEETQFLKKCFDLYSMDPAHHQGLVYLRWLRHTSYLMKYWLRFSAKGQQRFIYDIAKQLPGR
jgi:SAM-dependent methyltransferase